MAALLVAGCASMNGTGPGREGDTARVAGTVTYLQRSALPPTATIQVQLADVSRADAPAIVLAEQRIEARGRQVPFPFELAYDPSTIDPRMTYVVQARIEDGGRLLFVNDTRYAVITRGAPTRVEMLLRPAGAAAPHAGP